MTDQPQHPSSDSPAAPDPSAGWAQSPTSATPERPPEAAPQMPPAPSAAAAKPPSKLRTYLVGAVVIAVLAIGAYAISQNQLASDLAVGQCFDEPTSEVDITTVVKHPCTEAHDAEVFHVVEYTEGDAFPISLSLDRFIDETCVPAFGTYLGQPFESATDFDLGYFYPDRASWDKGDRTFSCYVTRVDGAKMTETVKAAGS